MEEPPPPGLPLATHVDPDKINDEVPLEAEMEAAVCCLRSHRAGGHTHLNTEQLKKWRKEAYTGDQSKTPSWRERWLCLVEIVQNMWRTGNIPQELGSTVLVLIPKETTDTQVPGLLETLWKVVEVTGSGPEEGRIQL